MNSPMQDKIAQFRKWLFVTPAAKTVAGVTFTIIASVFAGTFVAEISTPFGLDWRHCYNTTSIYILACLSILQYIYQKALYTHERSILNFLDNEYCKAYARSECIPEAIKQWKAKIKDGQGGELEKAMKELEKVLK